MGIKGQGRRKARLVVQGRAQRRGFECGSSSVPVCWFKSQRILLAIAAAKNGPVLALDVQVAFLGEKIQETVFRKRPPGFETGDPATGQPHVMGLRRALYGLAQNRSVWNSTIDPELQNIGFTAAASDHCVYTRGLNDMYVTLTSLVDGILLIRLPMKLVQDVQDKLQTKSSNSELGSVSLILGVEVTRDAERGAVNLSQHRYVISLLQKCNVESCNAVHTPGITNSTLSDTEEHILDK